MTETPNRWKRFDAWDERPLRLDKFAAEDWRHGFSAFSSPADPKPGIGTEGGRVISMDGVLESDFDMIDRFIATYHLDPAVAPEAMAMDSAQIATPCTSVIPPMAHSTQVPISAGTEVRV